MLEVGLQQNEVAQKVISSARLNKIIASSLGATNSPSWQADKRALRIALRNIQQNYGDNWPLGVLGVAEYLLDAGMPYTFLDTSRVIIDLAIARERSPESLAKYEDQDARRKELTRFKKRLQGKV